MDAKTLAYVAEAIRLMQAGLEIFNLANATLSRMNQAAGVPITDDDLAVLKGQREAALDRLRNLPR